MTDIEISKLTIKTACTKLESGELTSETLTRFYLERIAALDEKVGAYLLADENEALKQAIASDKRRKQKKALSKLDGIPIALKDNILTMGMQTTAASRILEGYNPVYEATVSKNLKAKGAVLLGKLNLDEFAMGSSNENSAFKVTKNPWDTSRSPGGSSGGSAAAVSAGFAMATLGSDTGGSIRQPAAFCGVVGIKPTYGRVSRNGIIAFASSLDQVGPFAKDVEGAASILEAIAGFDPRDSTSVQEPVPNFADSISGEVKGLKLGIAKEYFSKELDPEVKASVDKSIQVLQNAGATVEEVSLPSTPHAVATYYVITSAEASSNLARYDGVRYGPRLAEKEGLSSMYEETRGKLFGSEVKRRIMLGSYVLSAGYYDAYYTRAQKVRQMFANDFTKAFKKVDAIICPTAPTPAFKIGEKLNDPIQMYLNDIYTISANLTGLPALSFPSGFSKSGMPIGTQLIGKPFDEKTILNAALRVEKELNLDTKPPL